MRYEYTPHFTRKLKGFRDEALREKLKATVDEIIAAKSMANISGLKKIKGFRTFYRIRIGNYRVGVSIEKDVVTLADLDYRKDFYKHFPN